MKRQRKGQRGRLAKKKPSNDLEFLHHPLSGVDRDALQRALISVGQSAADEFPKLIDGILGHLKACSPLHVLSTMAGWGLMAGVSEAGASQKSIMSNVEQHQVELLQALAMTLPPGDWGRMPADPRRMTEIMEAIGKLTEAFHPSESALDPQQEVATGPGGIRDRPHRCPRPGHHALRSEIRGPYARWVARRT